jgi:hypothetical protein
MPSKEKFKSLKVGRLIMITWALFSFFKVQTPRRPPLNYYVGGLRCGGKLLSCQYNHDNIRELDQK